MVLVWTVSEIFHTVSLCYILIILFCYEHLTAAKDKIMPHLEKNRHLRETQSFLEYLADKILTGDIRSALNNQSISKYKKDTSDMQMKPHQQSDKTAGRVQLLPVSESS